jgi:HK97 family phage major capsid protein
MPAKTFPQASAWLPEENSSDVIARIAQTSAIEGLTTRVENMTTTLKSVPREAETDVDLIARSGTYGEDTAGVDDVTLRAFKFGKAVRIAVEDVDDSPIDLINRARLSWASSFAVGFDNACIGVNAAQSDTEANGVPYTSIYRTLTQNNAWESYTGGANSDTVEDTVTHAALSTVLGYVERGRYWNLPSMRWIMHPYFRQSLRDLVDSQGRPVFVDNFAGGQPDTLYGIPVRYSHGAITTTTFSQSEPVTLGAAGTAGNPLAVIVNTDHLIVGRRSGPESMLSTGEAGFLTDEAILKMRARRAFFIGAPQAAGLLELVNAV